MGVRKDRAFGPRIRCSYCYREKPRKIQNIKKSKWSRNQPVVEEKAPLVMSNNIDEKAHEVPETPVVKKFKTKKDA